MFRSLARRAGVQGLVLAAAVALAGGAMAATAATPAISTSSDARADTASGGAPGGDVDVLEIRSETGTAASEFGRSRAAEVRLFGECMAATRGDPEGDCAELRPGPAWRHPLHPTGRADEGAQVETAEPSDAGPSDPDGHPGAHGHERAAGVRAGPAAAHDERSSDAAAPGSGPPADAGPPGDAGPPAGSEPAGEAGPPDHARRPAEAGPPGQGERPAGTGQTADTGPPDHAGPPADTGRPDGAPGQPERGAPAEPGQGKGGR